MKINYDLGVDMMMFHLRMHWPKYFVSIFFLVGTILGVYLNNHGFFSNFSDTIKYVGFLFTVTSILLAVSQIRSTYDWNKRQMAINAAWSIKAGGSLDKSLEILDKNFKYIHRKNDKPISVELIHEKICEKDEDGKLKRGDDGAFIIDEEKGGREIFNAIRNVLNTYEYLATGIYQNVFDELIIKNLMAGSIIRAYLNFNEYIEHVNGDIGPNRKGKIWVHLTSLACRFIEEEDKNKTCANLRPPV